MFYFILPYLPLPLYCISNASHFPHTKGTMQKVQNMVHLPGYTSAMSGDWVRDWNPLVYYTYWERAHLQQKADAWDISIRRVPWHFIEFPLWIVHLYKARGLALLRKMVLEHFTGLKWAVKTRSINTISWIFLPKIKLNSKNPKLASSSCTQMRIFVSMPLSMQKASANAVTHGAIMKRRLHWQFSCRRLDWCYTIQLGSSLN